MEKWLPIKGYEGLYEISDKGRVKSLYSRYKGKSFLKQCAGSRGYLLVTLCRDGRQKTVNVHRLVAEAFLPNPNNLQCVNHKDENRQNNEVSNLEWCTYYHNNTFGDRLTKSALKKGKPVICVETGKIYANGQRAQAETEINQSSIWRCCNGRQKKAGGFHWSYIDC